MDTDEIADQVPIWIEVDTNICELLFSCLKDIRADEVQEIGLQCKCGVIFNHKSEILEVNTTKRLFW